MNKIFILNVLLLTNIYAFSFAEYKQMCEDNNEIVTAISSDGQSKSDAIASAEVIAQGKLVEKEFGTSVSSTSFLARAYKKLNDTESISEDFVKKITTKANGIIFPVSAKDTEFFPDGKGKGKGYAKAYMKKNCNSTKSFINFKHIFSD